MDDSHVSSGAAEEAESERKDFRLSTNQYFLTYPLCIEDRQFALKQIS